MSNQLINLKPTTSTLNALIDRSKANLPKHINVDLLKTNSMMYINQNNDIARYAEQNPMEVAQHLYNFVTLGLDVYRGDAYLLMYGKKLTPIIDYKGLIALVTRYSVDEILKIDFDMVKVNDKVNMLNGDLTHEYNPFENRGENVGVYVAVHYKNGAIKYTHMTKEEIYKVKASSPSSSSAYSPWTKWEDSMWIKTVIRNAMKTIPLDFSKLNEKSGAILQSSFVEADKDIDFNVNGRTNTDEVIDQSNVVDMEVESVEL